MAAWRAFSSSASLAARSAFFFSFSASFARFFSSFLLGLCSSLQTVRIACVFRVIAAYPSFASSLASALASSFTSFFSSLASAGGGVGGDEAAAEAGAFASLALDASFECLSTEADRRCPTFSKACLSLSIAYREARTDGGRVESSEFKLREALGTPGYNAHDVLADHSHFARPLESKIMSQTPVFSVLRSA